jgi:hypothetical protein
MFSAASWLTFIHDPAFGGIATAIGVFAALIGVLYSARVAWRGAKVQTLLKVTEWLELTRKHRDAIRDSKMTCPERMEPEKWSKLVADWDKLGRLDQNFDWLALKDKDDEIRVIAIEMARDMLTDAQRASIAEVCRSFDVLGFMDRHRLIDELLVDELYGTSLQSMHAPIFDAYVLQQRMVEPTRFWELVELDRRINGIRELHPANDDAHAWKRRRRRRSGLRGHARNVVEGMRDAIDRGFDSIDRLLD